MAQRKFIQLWRDLAALALALLFAFIVRTVAAEPFNVPSGSMVPTLLVGDTLIAGKYAYGFSKYSSPLDIVPEVVGEHFTGRVLEQPAVRGDVIVFKKPGETSVNYVKRLIGLPGDHVQMREGRLYINGEIVPRRESGNYSTRYGNRVRVSKRYLETLPGGHEHEILEITDRATLDETAEFVVPDGHYFAMGDNRDNSLDSRVPSEAGGVGYIPAENLVGRVDRIMYSRDPEASWWDLGALKASFRRDRFFTAVH